MGKMKEGIGWEALPLGRNSEGLRAVKRAAGGPGGAEGRRAGRQEGSWAGRLEGRRTGGQEGRRTGGQEDRRKGGQEGRRAGRREGRAGGQEGRRRGLAGRLLHLPPRGDARHPGGL